MSQSSPPQPRQGMVWRSATVGMSAGQPLAEWAYQTPKNTIGVRRSALPNLSREEQDEVVRSWFLSNYEPLGPGPWFAFDTPGAGLDEGVLAPPHWSPIYLIDEEFSEFLPAETRLAIARDFMRQAQDWRFVSDQVVAVLPEAAAGTGAELSAIIAELTARLERLERIQRAGDEARHRIGTNGGPSLVDIAAPVAEAKQAIADESPGDAKSAVSGFKELLPKLAEGAALAVGKHIVDDAWPSLPALAVWLFHEVCKIIPLLERWIDLVKAVIWLSSCSRWRVAATCQSV
jgi:hypothetical protein